MGGKAIDPNGEEVDAPGSSQWRYDTDSLAKLGAGVIMLNRSGAPVQNVQRPLYHSGTTLSTVPTPPRGWTKATGYRLLVLGASGTLGASGIPLDGVANDLFHLEVRNVLSPASPLIDLPLSNYSQNTGFSGNVGDLRGYAFPLTFNVMVAGTVPDGIGWLVLALQYGATTL